MAAKYSDSERRIWIVLWNSKFFESFERNFENVSDRVLQNKLPKNDTLLLMISTQSQIEIQIIKR